MLTKAEPTLGVGALCLHVAACLWLPWLPWLLGPAALSGELAQTLRGEGDREREL